MPMYRKKPVVIEARQVAGTEPTDFLPLIRWCGGALATTGMRDPRIEIKTLEGYMEARPGDWIIKGVAGEFYPCKDAIFRATYEPAE